MWEQGELMSVNQLIVRPDRAESEKRRGAEGGVNTDAPVICAV